MPSKCSATKPWPSLRPTFQYSSSLQACTGSGCPLLFSLPRQCPFSSIFSFPFPPSHPHSGSGIPSSCLSLPHSACTSQCAWSCQQPLALVTLRSRPRSLHRPAERKASKWLPMAEGGGTTATLPLGWSAPAECPEAQAVGSTGHSESQMETPEMSTVPSEILLASRAHAKSPA